MPSKIIASIMLFSALWLTACQPIAPVAAPTTNTATDSAVEDETRTITDAAGNEVTIPANPQRIVTLSEQDLDGALAVEVTVIGSVNGRGQATLPAYLSDYTEGITSVGALAEPSLEAIAALDPDIILAGGTPQAIVDQLPNLNEIAPTVVTYALTDDWKTAFLGTANALNKVAEAEAVLADYDAKVADLAERLGDNAGTTVSVVRWNPDGPGIMAYESFSTLVLRDLGLDRPEQQRTIEGYGHLGPISLEELEQLEADWLLIGTLNPQGVEALTAALENPLFQQLAVVQSGQWSTEIDGAIWTSRGGPIATEIVLNQVEAILIGE